MTLIDKIGLKRYDNGMEDTASVQSSQSINTHMSQQVQPQVSPQFKTAESSESPEQSPKKSSNILIIVLILFVIAVIVVLVIFFGNFLKPLSSQAPQATNSINTVTPIPTAASSIAPISGSSNTSVSFTEGSAGSVLQANGTQIDLTNPSIYSISVNYTGHITRLINDVQGQELITDIQGNIPKFLLTSQTQDAFSDVKTGSIIKAGAFSDLAPGQQIEVLYAYNPKTNTWTVKRIFILISTP